MSVYVFVRELLLDAWTDFNESLHECSLWPCLLIEILLFPSAACLTTTVFFRHFVKGQP